MGTVISLKKGQITTLNAASKDDSASITRLREGYAIKIIFAGENAGILAHTPEISTLSQSIEFNIGKAKKIKIHVNGGDGSVNSDQYLSLLQELFTYMDKNHPTLFDISYDVGIIHNGGSMLIGDLDLE